jgi:hydroxyethylthiazole kinase-like uncharacterized protein yjeF
MLELLSNTEMAEADRLAIAGGVPGATLMDNAGTAVAEAVAAVHPAGSRIVVVAGPGNNGGDGFVSARVLSEQGFAVRVLLLGTKERLVGDAAAAAQRWTGPTEAAQSDAIGRPDAVIDALFGAGLDRPVEGIARSMIGAMNSCGARIYAVDLPRANNGTTGAVMGEAVRASQTVTFFRRKPGHLLLPGRLHCGPIRVADIGIPAEVLARVSPRTFADMPPLWRLPQPGIDAHKYDRGHAVVVSGGLASTGAARLAARGALRAGAGLVTIASPRDALIVNAIANLAVMVHPVDGAKALTEFLADRRRNVVVLGPGGGIGAGMRDLVMAALAEPTAVVLDADALTSFAEDPASLMAAIKARSNAITILTPHEGEFGRLFRQAASIKLARSKLERARGAADVSGAVVLLKGPDTVVASPDGRAAIADNAPPWLATAGSGDVLAGFVAGLLAQGMSGFDATAAAVWLHGEAGREAGVGLIAEDLPEALRGVFAGLFGG